MARNIVDEPSEDVVAEAKRVRAARRNPFFRVVQFIREVIAELRRVVTPTRRDLISFTIVVLAFVVIMMVLVWGIDQGLGWLVLWTFGNPSTSGS